MNYSYLSSYSNSYMNSIKKNISTFGGSKRVVLTFFLKIVKPSNMRYMLNLWYKELKKNSFSPKLSKLTAYNSKITY